jgi:hypothetical protein
MILIILCKTGSVITAKCAIVWRITINNITRLQQRQCFVIAGTDKRCALSLFCKSAYFFSGKYGFL